MECQAPPSSCSFSPLKCVALTSSSSFTHSFLPLKPRTPFSFSLSSNAAIVATFSLKPNRFHSQRVKTRAAIDDKEKDQSSSSPIVVQEEEEQVKAQSNPEVEKSVKVLKNAAKTRKVAAEEILSALSVIEKAKIDPSGFLETLGGSKSPGRTWMLIFTAEKQYKSGRYFPITGVQRFDAAGKRIENGVYLGPIGSLTFEGRFTWKTKILSFIFERVRVKIGPLNPFEISLGDKNDREPSTKDPFFIWFYIDEEIAVARGKSGGTAFWCRCSRVPT
ncbi:hypothetical protein M5689_022864 [Euphorbia peplus]|nr:hypothetical protein M5689_022864 [Euphorbia peplus]